MTRRLRLAIFAVVAFGLMGKTRLRTVAAEFVINRHPALIAYTSPGRYRSNQSRTLGAAKPLLAQGLHCRGKPGR